MCGPALAILGGVAQAAGSIYSGMASAAGYEASAEGKKLEAITTLDSGAYDMNLQDQRNKALTGKQVTATAASGVDLWGTPADVITDSAVQGEMDKGAIRYNAQAKYKTKMYESSIDKMNAKSAETGGFVGAIAPLIGIGSAFQA
jgi:hypothetical protein